MKLLSRLSLLLIFSLTASASSLAFTAPVPASVVAASPAARAAGQAGVDTFGVPFPNSRDAKAWAQWREQVTARLRAKQAARGHKLTANATPATGSGLIETIAGSAPFQAPIQALQAGLGIESGVVADGNGNLYISTDDLGVVLKVDSSSNVTVYAGQPLPSGPAIPSGDGGPATSARLVAPFGLALDGSGNLYISDYVGATVRKVNASTGTITTVAGTPGQPGLSGDGGPATSATLLFPTGMAIDGNGNLYIADVLSIRQVNASTGTITTFAGDPNLNNPCYVSATNSCQAADLPMDLLGPELLAVGNGNLYVAGGFTGSIPSVISIGLTSGIAQLVAGGGTAPITPTGTTAVGASIAAVGVAVDKNGNLDIADINGYIEQVAPGGTLLTILAGNGKPGFAGEGGPATSASLIAPESIAVSPQGTIVFDDVDWIRVFTPGGTITTVAGDGTGNYFGDGGDATAAGLSHAADSVIDSKGNLLIADGGNGRVRSVNASTGVITTIAGNGSLPTSNGNGTFSGDGGPAVDAGIDAVNLALDGAGNLYVGSLDGIRVVNLSSGTIRTLSQLSVGGGMVFDGQHTLYAGQDSTGTNTQIVAIDLTTGMPTTVAGGGNEYYADGSPALGSVMNVQGLALDGNRNLYLSDLDTNTVRVVDLSTGIITTLVGTVTDGGRFGYSGDGGPASAASLEEPEGLRYDGAGHLLIADYNDDAIRSVDLTTDIITTVAGTGNPGYTGDGGNSTAADLNQPYGVAVDLNGNLFIADSSNDRMRRVLVQPAALSSALAASSMNFVSGTSVTLTATCSGISFGIAPTGNVTFLDGTTSIGTGSFAVGMGGSYVATLTISTLAVGKHSITAQYAGDAHYAANTSAAVVLTVTAPPPPTYAVTAAPASLMIAQGATGTTVLTVTPANGFNQAVSFSCGTGLPTGVSCSLAPASVTPSGVAAVTTTLTVTTTGATEAVLGTQAKPEARWWISGGATSLACLLMMGLPGARRRSRWLAISACAMVLGAGIVGCGSGSGGGGGGTNPNATPLGTYTLKLATTAGSGSSGLSEPVSLTITVTN